MSQSLLIHVRGMTPIPWGSNEMAWRGKVAEEARLIRTENQLQGITSLTHFSVDIVFLMRQMRIEVADLDNLAKPVLDTLFRSRYAQVKDLRLTGALFDVDDDRVFKLTLEKKLVASITEEGIDVTITYN